MLHELGRHFDIPVASAELPLTVLTPAVDIALLSQCHSKTVAYRDLDGFIFYLLHSMWRQKFTEGPGAPEVETFGLF